MYVGGFMYVGFSILIVSASEFAHTTRLEFGLHIPVCESVRVILAVESVLLLFVTDGWWGRICRGADSRICDGEQLYAHASRGAGLSPKLVMDVSEAFTAASLFLSQTGGALYLQHLVQSTVTGSTFTRTIAEVALMHSPVHLTAHICKL